MPSDRYRLILHSLALQMYALEATDTELKEAWSRIELDGVMWREKLLPFAEKACPLAELIYENYNRKGDKN